MRWGEAEGGGAGWDAEKRLRKEKTTRRDSGQTARLRSHVGKLRSQPRTSHPVSGQVTKGMDIATKISKVPTGRNHSRRKCDPTKMRSALYIDYIIANETQDFTLKYGEAYMQRYVYEVLATIVATPRWQHHRKKPPLTLATPLKGVTPFKERVPISSEQIVSGCI